MTNPSISVQARTDAAVHWTRKDLLDTDTLTRGEIELILETARSMAEVRAREIAKVPTLRGVTVANLFYENSTRTRASFEVAGKALGADVINLAASASSVAKGESLIDTIRTIEAIGANIIVLRHHRSGAPYLAARNSKASVINAGDGAHGHPTQALLDLYTMQHHLGDVTGRKVVIVGDVLHSRVARSNAWLLTAMGAEVVLCGPPTLVPRYLGAGAAELPPLSVTTDLDGALSGADVVMALRMQRERQDSGRISSVREYVRRFQITGARLGLASPGALVMHPGPMNEGVEIAPDVAHGAASVIEEQVSAGVAIRMAVLFLIAGRVQA